MSKAEEFLNNHKDGYNSFKIHEMISLPKIKIQALMSEFSDEQFKSRVNAISDEEMKLGYEKEAGDYEDGWDEGYKEGWNDYKQLLKQ